MKILASLFGAFIAWGLSLCVMIFGWGLHPVSWGWVIWGSIGAIMVGAIVSALAEAS